MAQAPVVLLHRTERFSACHRLHSRHLSDVENREIFGLCNNPNGHGHNYVWRVTLQGPVHPTTGMVYNLSDLKKEMAEVVKMVDHKNLDLDVEYFHEGGVVSTTENLTVFLHRELAKVMKRPELLLESTVDETEKNVFTFREIPSVKL
uniref:6-pyruvoyl tetrahydrobiopterin synthase n=1 Tax=Steinernema glaseri TaxID=37863 RepID=A0A1I7XYY6_9BILA